MAAMCCSRRESVNADNWPLSFADRLTKVMALSGNSESAIVLSLGMKGVMSVIVVAIIKPSCRDLWPLYWPLYIKLILLIIKKILYQITRYRYILATLLADCYQITRRRQLSSFSRTMK